MTKHFLNLTHDTTSKLAKLPNGEILELRTDSSTPGRIIFGYALPGTAQTDFAWYIFAEDTVGTSFHRQFAEVSNEPIADFIHQWSDRNNILPGQVFLNEFSVQFSGATNSYATVADSADLDFANTDAFSFSIYWKTTDGSQTLFQKTSSTGGNNGYTLTLDASGRLEFSFRGVGTGDRIRVRTDSFITGADGSWHHVVITKASGSAAASTVNLYVDDNDETLNVLNDTLTGTTTNSSVLAVAANIAGSVRFTGNIDEPAVWNAQLTSAEVTEIYNTNSGTIDLQSGSGQILSALVSWWRMGDGSFAAIPTIPDEEGTNTMTLQSAVTSGDVESEVPP